MKNTIIVTDLTRVRVGDKAYFKDCDFGFTVLDVNKYDKFSALKVNIPMSEDGFCADPSLFVYATRVVEEPEWPDPNDLQLHIYLGSDGKKYLYNPVGNADHMPWAVENSSAFQSRDDMTSIFPEALPLIELECIPMEIES